MNYSILFLIVFLLISQFALGIEYPYAATKERTDLIKSRFLEIKIGLTEAEVLKILPDPDEIRELFEPKKYKPKTLGKTFWYILKRKRESGSVIEKDEAIVRISFDLKGIVTAVDNWGF